MKDRHHYDEHGKYIGKSTDTPPTAKPGILAAIVGVVLLVCVGWPILQMLGIAWYILGPFAIFVILFLVIGAASR